MAAVRRPEPILPDQLGLKTLYEPRPGSAAVDVVAVHGIGANPDKTWVSDGVNWLSHERMLPATLGKARIMRFGYDSQWFGDHVIKARLSTVSNELLRALGVARSESSLRPILFVAHCFGGLVIQQALTTALSLRIRHPTMIDAQVGIVFLGTPHFGTGSITSEGLVLAALAAEPTLHVDKTLLQTITYGNDTLRSTVDTFVGICGEPGSRIRFSCFFEQEITAVGKVIGNTQLKEFVVDDISGIIPGHPSHGLPLNHFRLIKFSSPDDGNYRAVRDEIHRLVKEITRTKPFGQVVFVREKILSCPWDAMTVTAMDEYQRMYEACKDPDGHVRLHTVQSRFHWSAFDNSDSPGFKEVVVPRTWTHLVDSTETRLSLGLALALFFILHLQSIGIEMPQSPNGFKPIRKRQFPRFGNWVPCRCGCGRRWNFANQVGLQKNQNGRCKADIYLNGRGILFHWRGRRYHQDNLMAWKIASA